MKTLFILMIAAVIFIAGRAIFVVNCHGVTSHEWGNWEVQMENGATIYNLNHTALQRRVCKRCGLIQETW